MENSNLFKFHFENGNIFEAESIEKVMKMRYEDLKNQINHNIKHNHEDDGCLVINELERQKTKLGEELNYIKYLKNGDGKINCKCGKVVDKKHYNRHLTTKTHIKNST